MISYSTKNPVSQYYITHTTTCMVGWEGGVGRRGGNTLNNIAGQQTAKSDFTNCFPSDQPIIG